MKRPINLAIVFDEEHSSGGAFQQTLTAALQCKSLHPELVNTLCITTYPQTYKYLLEKGLQPLLFRVSTFQRQLSRLRHALLSSSLLCHASARLKLYSRFQKYLLSHHIDLVYFLSPTEMQFDVDCTNYISTVWDLCHLDQPEFPEVRLRNEHLLRQRLYDWILPRSFAVIADSAVGKDNIVHHYRINPSRITISPFRASAAVDSFVNDPSNSPAPSDLIGRLPDSFIFYPAQFWAHKNHTYILRALALYTQRYLKKIPLVLCGTDKGNFDFVMQTASDLGILDQIHCLGFVPDSDMPYLYKKSTALVMPTYFGLTNLPPLEAFCLGTPVLYSDLPYLREQVSGASLLLDLNDPNSLVEALHLVYTSPTVVGQLIESGIKKYKLLTSNSFESDFTRILTDFQSKLMSWS